MLILFKFHQIPKLSQQENSNDPQVSNSTLVPRFNENRWAIPRRQNARFTFEQRNFLYEEFIIGEETGQKTIADKFIKKMGTKYTTGV